MKSKIYSSFSDDVSDSLRQGKIGVLPTDTIYGICGQALNRDAVEKIYNLKNRNTKKPFIILIGSLTDLNLFGITLSPETKEFIQKVWPGKVSIVFSCAKKELEYLHRGKNTLAFRFPKNEKLRNLLVKTGPLVAPSANPEGKKFSRRIKTAVNYFGDQADFYVNGGFLFSRPSTLVQVKNGQPQFLRSGAWPNLTRKIFKKKK